MKPGQVLPIIRTARLPRLGDSIMEDGAAYTLVQVPTTVPGSLRFSLLPRHNGYFKSKIQIPKVGETWRPSADLIRYQFYRFLKGEIRHETAGARCLQGGQAVRPFLRLRTACQRPLGTQRVRPKAYRLSIALWGDYPSCVLGLLSRLQPNINPLRRVTGRSPRSAYGQPSPGVTRRLNHKQYARVGAAQLANACCVRTPVFKCECKGAAGQR
jgi:hypothetical protein